MRNINNIGLIKIKMDRIKELESKLNNVIIGQKTFVRDILIAFLSGGHILIESVPGLGKTSAVKSFSKMLGLSSKRIQFTPDLLPSDLIGMEVYDEKQKEFYIKKGPIFSDIILADEINRAGPKLQSALLEAMEEKQVTIGDNSYMLSSDFFVLATSNPIEHEGVYRLPEAQIDRFLLKTVLGYPEKSDEVQIIKHSLQKNIVSEISQVLSRENIDEIKKEVAAVYADDKILDYVGNILSNSRQNSHLEYGYSSRAGIGLVLSAKSSAYLSGRDYVIPEDIKAVSYSVLLHRTRLSYQAISENVSHVDIIDDILNNIDINEL